MSTPNGKNYNYDQLSRLLPSDGSVVIEDVSETMGVVAIAGPKSREILQPLTDNDLSNQAFPWLSAQTGEVGYARDTHLLRISYTGELGWELHHPIGYNRHIVDALIRAGAPHGLKLFGAEALESLRLRKILPSHPPRARPGRHADRGRAVTFRQNGQRRIHRPRGVEEAGRGKG